MLPANVDETMHPDGSPSVGNTATSKNRTADHRGWG